MSDSLHEAWKAAGLDVVDLSRLNDDEREQAAQILNQEPISEKLQKLIAASRERIENTPSREVAEGFGVVLPDGQAGFEGVIRYAVKDIPDVSITTVSGNELFFSAPKEHLEQLGQQLARFDGAKGIGMPEGTLSVQVREGTLMQLVKPESVHTP